MSLTSSKSVKPKMPILRFDLSSQEFEQLNWISRRAKNLGLEAIDVHMHLTVAHLNSCRLDLAGLIKAEDEDFRHDVLGIIKNLAKDGKLQNFTPIFKQRTV